MEKYDQPEAGIKKVSLCERITTRLSDADIKQIADLKLKAKTSASNVIRRLVRCCPLSFVEQEKEK